MRLPARVVTSVMPAETGACTHSLHLPNPSSCGKHKGDNNRNGHCAVGDAGELLLEMVGGDQIPPCCNELPSFCCGVHVHEKVNDQDNRLQGHECMGMGKARNG